MIVTRRQRRQIQEHLGHREGYRRVRIMASGEVYYYGSTDSYDRQHDYWHYAGTAEEVLRDAEHAETGA